MERAGPKSTRHCRSRPRSYGSPGTVGSSVRIGLEDVLTLPGGELPPGNAELVAAIA
jgi:hypothetical protein